MSTNLGLLLGERVLDAGIATGSGALAGLALNSPAGAAGGALGAAAGWLAGKFVMFVLFEGRYHIPQEVAYVVSKIVQLAVTFFVSVPCFMLANPFMGVPLAFSASCALAAVTMGISLALWLPILGIHGVATNPPCPS